MPKSRKKKFQPVELWEGWYFDGIHLCDQAGNKWNREGLYAALMGEQLHREITGSIVKVHSMKQELQKRIDAMAPPEILLHWNDQEIKVNFR